MRPKLILITLVAVTLLFGRGATWSDDDEEEDDEDKEGMEEDAVLELYRRLLERIERKREEKKTDQAAQEFLKEYNRTETAMRHKLTILQWAYSTNVTTSNAAAKNAYAVKLQAWKIRQAWKAQELLHAKGLDKVQRRRMEFISTNAYLKSESDRKALESIKSHITQIYSKAQVVLENGKRLTPGESGVEAVFKNTSDYDLLAEAWQKWRDVTGKQFKSSYVEMVKLLNKGASENDYRDYGYYEWFTDFRDPKFNEKVVSLFQKIKPLYQELHAYVRYKLSQKYPGRFDPKGPIPAHLFGNVWAQLWQNIFPLVKPYKNASSTDVTSALKAQKWTVHRMFKTAEEFFTSIGLYKMTPKFWAKSMFVNPGNRSVECHGSAWDFSNLDDFRIKMCTKVNQEDFKTIHHEMGHVEYYMSYRKQPMSFRGGANSGFHEAIGDTIALSVSTDKHFQKIGLLKSTKKPSKKADINALMRMALSKIAFLPFALLVDTWRWRVFNGTIPPHDYNKGWWKLRHELQGLRPPVKRSDSDFDAGAKYHVAANVPYIRYFTSFIMQFQFYEAMCNKSGHTGPLHQCDFYQSKPAGDLLKSMLKLGRSRPWPEAMKLMTGQKEISLDSLNKYFNPLRKWLVDTRKAKGYPIGW